MREHLGIPFAGRIIHDAIELYSYCADLIEKPETDPRAHRISIASLHGHVGRRVTDDVAADSPLGRAIGRFTNALRERVTSVTEPWRVRQLLNVVSEERLSQALRRQLSLTGQYYEIKAFSDDTDLSPLSPLIIGDEHAFLALDDSRHFHAASAVHLKGPEAVNWVQQHFDNLWNEAPWLLRDTAGLRQRQLNDLRDLVAPEAAMHPMIVAASRVLFDDGHFENATQQALRAVESRVQKLTASGDVGARLMGKTFSKDNPALNVATSVGHSEAGENEGWQHLFIGATTALRNPRSHGEAIKDEPHATSEYLSFASMLMRRLDLAESRLNTGQPAEMPHGRN